MPVSRKSWFRGAQDIIMLMVRKALIKQRMIEVEHGLTSICSRLLRGAKIYVKNGILYQKTVTRKG